MHYYTHEYALTYISILIGQPKIIVQLAGAVEYTDCFSAER